MSQNQTMQPKRTSVTENGLIWFGAAVSIAEILTGTYLAPLGLQKGLLAVVTGHLIGCILLFLAGAISAQKRKSAMEATKDGFGHYGGIFFAILNIIQLVGWTSIMIFDGAAAANEIFDLSTKLWSVLIGLLIIIWIAIGITHLGKLNLTAMILLFVLSIILCFVIFRTGGVLQPMSGDAITFGAGVELSAAMPISWLPLMGDYTREAEKPIRATAVSAVVYGITSCFMYFIGLSAVLLTGETDIAKIMLKAGLGIAGLLIIIFSTVTTTFLDAYSAGISSETVSRRLQGKTMAICVTILGILATIFLPLGDITEFLYLIGSVFAPMIAVMIADAFIVRKFYKSEQRELSKQARASEQKETPEQISVPPFQFKNLIIWFIGFCIYRFLLKIDTPLGSTLPAMLLTMLLCIIISGIEAVVRKR